MRPNVDEYDDIDDETSVGNSEGVRAVSWVVLTVAVGGFAALAYYAYHSGAKSMSESVDVPVVEADAGPIKEAPLDPEGEQFANQDKTIYNVIANDGRAEPEKLMPEPERPVIAADVEDSEDSQPVIEPVTRPEPMMAAPVPEPVVPEVAAVAPTPAPIPAPPAAPEKMETAAVDTKKSEKSYEAPEMINETTVTGKPEAAPVEEKPKAEAPKPAKAKPAGGGASKVQLGAFASESEARAAWKKLSAKYASVLTGSPTIVKADVNGKTYYRLRTNVADAKAACATINPCMAVK